LAENLKALLPGKKKKKGATPNMDQVTEQIINPFKQLCKDLSDFYSGL
jgi:hypothetical protein